MVDPKELYSRCEGREKELNDKEAGERLKWDVIQGLRFGPCSPQNPHPVRSPGTIRLRRALAN